MAWVLACACLVAPAMRAAGAVTADGPTSASEALSLPRPAGLPSGWDALVAAIRKSPSARDPESNLRVWGAPRLLSAMRDQARFLESAVRRRQRDEAAGRAADMHRLSLHLIDRLASAPTTDTARLWPALRLEVLVQSLDESIHGENPGRARIYVRQIERLIDEMRAPPGSMPQVEIPPMDPAIRERAGRK